MIAALGHDLNHSNPSSQRVIHEDGVGNMYYIAANHEWAITYSTESVLESMHASTLFKLISKNENDILKTLPKDQKKIFKQLAISSILATDI